jgi:hypothetical protein
MIINPNLVLRSLDSIAPRYLLVLS